MSEADGPGNERPGRERRDEDASLSRRLKDLDRRIGTVRPEEEKVADPDAPPRTGYALALRMGADLVAGVLVGAVLGWGVDWLLGTSPWGLIVFFLVGFAAGLLSVMRSAGMIAKRPGIDDDPATRRFD
ncbi:AtpZ/AtpI family protein [Bauldia sp.]|uniref:AtpZ/AtpI family protein n=1 Tax=Bauldia sp. TaxID=2575872 RepID=UPI003BAC3CE0